MVLLIKHQHKNKHNAYLLQDNLMFARNCNISCPIYVKIADFNLACVTDSEGKPALLSFL